MSLCGETTKDTTERNIAMALDQSALLEVLDALAMPMPMIGSRQAAETIYQALIDAELTAVIGAAPARTHRDHGRRSATGTARGR